MALRISWHISMTTIYRITTFVGVEYISKLGWNFRKKFDVNNFGWPMSWTKPIWTAHISGLKTSASREDLPHAKNSATNTQSVISCRCSCTWVYVRIVILSYLRFGWDPWRWRSIHLVILACLYFRWLKYENKNLKILKLSTQFRWVNNYQECVAVSLMGGDVLAMTLCTVIILWSQCLFKHVKDR